MLTSPKALTELIGKPVTSLNKLLNHLTVILRHDYGDDILGPLDLAGQLNLKRSILKLVS